MKERKTAIRPGPRATKSDGFRHILIPTDLTARTDKALELAGGLASQDAAARITLLHVIETIDGLPVEELEPFYKRMERKARTAMSAAVRRAPGIASRTDADVVRGKRAEEIVKFADAHGIDLIVLASHRVNPSMVNRDWGTISYKVGILARCPVLLVK